MKRLLKTHKCLKGFLDETKIYFETIVMVSIAFMTFKISLAANAISEKQAELAKEQVVLTKKQYEYDYLPRLVVNQYDTEPCIMVEDILLYCNKEIIFSEDGLTYLDLFTDFNDEVFDTFQFYYLLDDEGFKDMLLYKYGLDDYNQNINGSFFKDVILNLNEYEKYWINSIINKKLCRSGDIYEIENIGARPVNDTINYKIDVSVTIPEKSNFFKSYHFLVCDLWNSQYKMNGDMVVVQCLNPIYIRCMLDDFTKYLKKELENDRISVSYTDCLSFDYDDNGEFQHRSYFMCQDELILFDDSECQEFLTIYSDRDREEILSYIRKQTR